MGLLDNLSNAITGGGQSGSANPAVAGIMELINDHPGGVSGLVQAFHDNGLGDLAKSWVGSGQNLPVSADQIQQVLGNDKVQALASKLGVSPEQATSHLSELLPSIVDKLSPNGQLPQGGNLLDMGKNLLGSLGKTGTDS